MNSFIGEKYTLELVALFEQQGTKFSVRSLTVLVHVWDEIDNASKHIPFMLWCRSYFHPTHELVQ